jgi:hypothetical protein
MRGDAVSNIKQSVAERDGNRLRAVHRPKLGHRDLSMLVDRSIAHRADRSETIDLRWFAQKRASEEAERNEFFAKPAGLFGEGTRSLLYGCFPVPKSHRHQ